MARQQLPAVLPHILSGLCSQHERRMHGHGFPGNIWLLKTLQ